MVITSVSYEYVADEALLGRCHLRPLPSRFLIVLTKGTTQNTLDGNACDYVGDVFTARVDLAPTPFCACDTGHQSDADFRSTEGVIT